MPKAGIAGLKMMLSSGVYADVQFLVDDGDGKELLSAHKHILNYASDVFEAMFRFDAMKEEGEYATANCPVVEVPDVEAAAFKVMLSFIYIEDLSELNGDNAMAVLYAAKKYNIPDLVDASLRIPISKLHNIFLAYAQSGLFGLENYGKDCLAYIDNNAETLIESEAFLQIDQKLLSENRRQMLGPALFKIRFPLFSREDFSEKIVPSGILTPNEVIGLEQYRTNPNLYGISGALLYQLQFPSHQRIKAFGTLLMNIEKVSEFASEIFLGLRESDSVTYIKKLQWKICTEIRTKNGNSDIEKWLGIYLLCVGPKEDQNWSCKCSATVRIVSQKNDVSDFMGQLNERWLNNQTRGWGKRYMISFAQLMDTSNGLYNKSEDKVTVAIDVTVKEVKTEDKS
ncbi:hypothetical protein niasHT_012515 [Heterodera trifolii]|uniref:BTB domain-containing protein n=1 Tax=Heterodera trifolii TaxID=157864 RepID=A0ABD2LCY6_9BILA